MRATEFLDFLNRDNLENIENQYSHFNPLVINKNNKKILDKKLLKIRREYRKRKNNE
tara:strand:+ start:284 stop:454 length:171 start_codon:yes stop_codon:yes gene_type:complete